MLVCPQCQFENLSSNKFCQECGTSLTHRACPSCDSQVAIAAQQCPNCGTLTGTIWWAVISEVTDPETIAAEKDDLYIDSQQRYQRLEPPKSPYSGTVLDGSPLQNSPLKAQEFSGLKVPVIAEVYQQLRSQLHQIIPQIHDAWRSDHQEVLLLEDRSRFPLVVDCLQHDRALSMLKVLHWFHEMVSIWEALVPWQCCQSLLDPKNLRIDEDQMLCLQQLSQDSSAPSLQHLGKTWQFLLDQRSQTQIATLYLLIADLQAGKLITTYELRSRIEAIAHEIQASATEATEEIDMMPNPQDLPAPDSTHVPLEIEDATSEAVTLQPEEEGDDMPTIVLPMQLFSLEDAGRTDIGRTRDHNEDCFGIDTTITKIQIPSGRTIRAQGLYILCDGMGGHASGEVASQLAVDTLRRYFRDYWKTAADSANSSGLPPLTVLREAVQLANQAIYDVNQQNARSGSGRMGTTMVMLLIQDTEAAVAHVGDSRLYCYSRKGGLKQVTSDHEVGQREILRGIDSTIAYSRPDAYQLTQALGPRDENFISPDVQFFELNEDMVLILASDGLTDNDLLETHCATHIEPLVSSMTNLEQGVNQLIELANQYNGHDNITAIAIRAKVRPNLEQLW